MSGTPRERRAARRPPRSLRLGTEAVERARRAGADHAEACLESLRSFTVRVNGGAIESLKQSVTRGLGLRVLVGGAQGFVSSTDLAPDSLDELARHAVALARFSTPDEANAFPTPAEAGDEPLPDLELVDPALLALARRAPHRDGARRSSASRSAATRASTAPTARVSPRTTGTRPW